jgi:hypothetical protein
VAGCPIQVEPPAIEAWRSDADAGSWAREHADGWTSDPIRRTDYCPAHTQFSTAQAAGDNPPRPTAAARDASGDPLDRDAYAERLAKVLADGDRSAGRSLTVRVAEAAVAARLLDELAGVYRGERLAALAHELAALLDSRLRDQQ